MILVSYQVYAKPLCIGLLLNNVSDSVDFKIDNLSTTCLLLSTQLFFVFVGIQS